MSDARAMPWPSFGRGGKHSGWDPTRWIRMAGDRGGWGRQGPRAFGPWGNPRGGGLFGAAFPPFPPGPPFGPQFGEPGRSRQFWGGPKVRRGDVRAAVLALLAEEPRNGYQIIQEIAERSGGVWRPSAGSVYPALQQLEDEGLARAVESGARRLFELTEEGRTYVEANADKCAAPWEAVSDTVGEHAMELRDLIGGVAGAAVQVMRAGSAAQAAEARRILVEARRSLYRILAEDAADAEDVAEAEEDGAAEHTGKEE